MDLIVTTPKKDAATATAEAASLIAAGGGYYFRRLSPRLIEVDVHPGDRVFYVEDGHIRGSAQVVGVSTGSRACSLTRKEWGEGTFVVMDAASWQWVRPTPHPGFQGFRYFRGAADLETVGGWQDPRPA